MFLKNNKLKPILSTIVILLLIVIASGLVWMKNSEGGKTRAEGGATAISSCDNSLFGAAWSENIGYISMTGEDYSGADYSVKIDSGVFSGFAWSENIGWVNFAPTGPYPADPQAPVEMNPSTGDIAGWVSIVIDRDNPTATTAGWIKMSDTTTDPLHPYGVKADLITKKLSGFAWSEDYGWIDFSQVTYGCPGVGGVMYNDGILVYTSAHRKGVLNEDASVTSGENIVYSLEITNQGNMSKVVNLKFDLPYGYTHIINTTTCTAGITPCLTPPEGGINGNGSNKLTWTGVTIPAGESKISFELRAP